MSDLDTTLRDRLSARQTALAEAIAEAIQTSECSETDVLTVLYGMVRIAQMELPEAVERLERDVGEVEWLSPLPEAMRRSFRIALHATPEVARYLVVTIRKERDRIWKLGARVQTAADIGDTLGVLDMAAEALEALTTEPR